jgi:hypothetical protein
MILNLNDPSKIEDTSWIKPMKYVGIWWETNRLGFCRFTKCSKLLTQELLPSGKHGATTENTKDTLTLRQNGFDGVEGWNVGWEDWFGTERGSFDFVTRILISILLFRLTPNQKT